MLDTHLMIRSDNGAFKQTPDALNPVSVNVTHNPFLLRVIDPLVACVGIVNAPVSRKLIRVDRFRVGSGVIVNEFVKYFLSRVRNDLKPNLSRALNCSNSD